MNPRYFLLLAILLMLVVPSSAWYSTYGYRQLHNITGTTTWTGNQTNYQVKITLSNASGVSSAGTMYTNGTTLPTWNDVRFTSLADSPYDYWLETGSETANTVIAWVEVPTIVNSTSATQLYVYYNKSGDTSASNGTATFQFFDHFDTIDTTTKWDMTGTVQTSGSFANDSASGTNYLTTKTFTVTIPFAVEMRLKNRWPGSGTFTTGAYPSFGTAGSPTAGMWWYYDAGDSYDRHVWKDGVGGWAPGAGRGLPVDVNSIIRHSWIVENTTMQHQISSGGVTADDYFSGTNGADGKKINILGKASSDGYVDYDYLAVRLYNTIEPAHSTWGAPESPSTGDTTPPASITGLANNTTCNSINFTWTNPGDADFNGTYLWLNNTAQTNLSNTTTFKLIEGLSEGLSVEFASKTFDNKSPANVNTAFVNMTAVTKTSATASFTRTPADGLTPLSVQVNDTSTGSSLSSWNWSWGDTTWTNTSVFAERNATRVYGTGGNYTIFLITSNLCGADQSDNQYVNVYNQTTSFFIPSESSFSVPPDHSITCTPQAVNATTYNWSFWNGTWYNTTSSADITAVFTTGGTFDIQLLTTDNGWGIDTHNETITVTQILAPVSDFTKDKTAGLQPLTVQFNDTSTNTPTLWNWSFGDGTWFNTSTSSARNASHIYNSGGTYPVYLISSNVAGSDQSDSQSVSVYNQTNANFTQSAYAVTVPPDQSVTFTYDGTNATWFNWSFWNGTWYNTTSSAAITGVFTDGGNRTINLTTSDNGWGLDTHYGFVNVTQVGAPTAEFTAEPPLEGNAPLTIEFQDLSTGDGIITWNWSFGDGSYSDTQSPSHEYTSFGIYDVNLTVTNLAGSDSELKNDYITVYNTTPVADYLANRTSGCLPAAVQFTDNSTGTVHSWSWTINGVEFSTAQNPVYTFTEPGLYEWVNLTVTNDGGSDTMSGQDAFYFVDCAPDPITGLTNNTGTCEQVTFDWDNPTNANFNHTYVMQDGVWNQNVSNSSSSVTFTGLTGGVPVSFNGTTVSILGNMSTSWVNMTATPTSCADSTPPGNITGLTPTVDSCSQITWDWTNPTDDDYSLVMVYRNNVHLYNLSKPDNQDVWSSLEESTSYTFSSRTVDTSGNLNTSWTNATESTTACPHPPVSDFTADDTTICAGGTVSFTDESTYSPTSWIWDIDGDGDSDYTTENPTHQYLTVGSFSVHHKATNADGSDWENKTNYITTTDCSPTAAFSANETSVCADAPILFTDASTGTPNNWDWYFWDNETKSSDLQNPVTSFNLTGTYSIRLLAQNTYGSDFENKTSYITVNDCTPDSTPPGSVTNLNGTSASCGTVTWTWTDPVDDDLRYVQLWFNDAIVGNRSPGIETYTVNGLGTGNYTLSTRTLDFTGNWNTSWENSTVYNVTVCAAPTSTGGTGGATVTEYGGRLWTYSILLLASVILLLYGFIDNKNRVYGNIIATFISSLIAVYLSITAMAGFISYNTYVSSIVQFGSTAPQYTYAYSYLNDSSLGYMVMVLAVVGMIYTFLMIYEAYGVKKRNEMED